MILLLILFNGRSNAGDFPVSGKIGNTIFTIFICIFTIFPLNWGRDLIDDLVKSHRTMVS